MKEYKPELKPPRLRGERKNTMVDINKLIEYLEKSSDNAYFCYNRAKEDGEELEAMRYVTQMSDRMLFIELLKDETFLDKMHKVYFPEQETDAD